MSEPHYTAIVLKRSMVVAGRFFEVARFKGSDVEELYDLVDSWFGAMGWGPRHHAEFVDPEGEKITPGDLLRLLGARVNEVI